MSVTGKHMESGINPLRLRFMDPSLEEEFTSHIEREVRIFNRIGIVLSYFAWLSLVVFLYVKYHEHYLSLVKGLLFFLYPTFTVNLFVLSSPRYQKYFQLTTAISNAAAGLGIIYYGHYVLKSNILALSGITVVVLFAFFILRLRFRVALWTTLIYVLIYQIALLYSGRQDENGLILFLMWVIQCTCVVGGNILERASRKTFYQNKLREQAEQEIAYLAYHDTLTGLPNRYQFTEKLKHLVQADRPFAVLFVDLDDFKSINDTRGHTIGDQLLKQVADRLIDCVRRKDKVSRIGGDEFTIILPTKSKPDVARIAEKIVKAIQEPFVIGGGEFYMRTSIGISFYPQDGTDAETLIKHADIAMYRSKEQGGNNYKFFNTSMKQLLDEKISLRRVLNSALANDEFVLYYQPQIDLRTGKLFGVEALIRWMHPERGLIAPDQFIPIAEETGLIMPIGDWVLKTACTQAAKWNRKHRHPVHLSVNLSVRQFVATDLVATVDQILQETGLDPTLLELELTESIFLQHTKSVVTTMRQLKQLGVRISIDDFGTGYSSLAYLKDFPIDSLKTERSFVSNLPENRTNAAIISAVIALARNLGIKSIAEGIETPDQLSFFQMEGCDIAQGYYFSRPVPVDQMCEILENPVWDTRIADGHSQSYS